MLPLSFARAQGVTCPAADKEAEDDVAMLNNRTCEATDTEDPHPPNQTNHTDGLTGSAIPLHATPPFLSSLLARANAGIALLA